ncbi:MAG TPA: YCF48-related protein [Candidatus Kapabacteria bacterium]|nr:YCF48-related protein [Candidatus Kapabacteria bacterium]
MKKLTYVLMVFLAISSSYAKDLWIENIVPGPYTFPKIQFLDSLTGFAFGPTNLLKTTDGGKTWEEKIMVEFMGNALMDFVMFPDGYGFLMRAQNIYQISTDFGDTWTDHPVPSKHRYTWVQAFDHNRIWAIDPIAKVIILTKDGGSSWDSLKFANYNDLLYISSVHFFNDEKGLIGAYSGKILKTTDGGKNWTELAQVLDSNLNTLFFIDDENGWLGCPKGTLYRTTDGGDTWNKINSPSDNEFASIYFFNENEGFISTMKEGSGFSYTGDLYYTSDGGASWQLQRHIANYFVSSFSFVNKNLGWASIFSSNILLKYDNTTSVDEEISEQIEKRTVFLFSDRKVHPIPASSEVTANVYWNEQYYLIENAKIKVYTSYGDEITNPEISIEKLAPYKANIKWNCSNFASGIYFIYISLGDENMAIPVIVSR